MSDLVADIVYNENTTSNDRRTMDTVSNKTASKGSDMTVDTVSNENFSPVVGSATDGQAVGDTVYNENVSKDSDMTGDTVYNEGKEMLADTTLNNDTTIYEDLLGQVDFYKECLEKAHNHLVAKEFSINAKGCIDMELAFSLLDRDKIEVSEDFVVSGLHEEIARIKESKPFLFKEEDFFISGVMPCDVTVSQESFSLSDESIKEISQKDVMKRWGDVYKFLKK